MSRKRALEHRDGRAPACLGIQERHVTEKKLDSADESEMASRFVLEAIREGGSLPVQKAEASADS
jgi:hypothetical protein